MGLFWGESTERPEKPAKMNREDYIEEVQSKASTMPDSRIFREIGVGCRRDGSYLVTTGVELYRALRSSISSSIDVEATYTASEALDL